MQDYATARQNMVDSQIKPNRVTDIAVMDAMREVPRELFVPTIARGVAYVDEDIRIADGRYLMEPMVLARLLDAAAIRRDDVVLDIGCGTGYSTAVLARLANTVVAVESDRDLARGAGELLLRLGVDNAVIVDGPLTDGYPAQAPYQVIVLEGPWPACRTASWRSWTKGGAWSPSSPRTWGARPWGARRCSGGCTGRSPAGPCSMPARSCCWVSSRSRPSSSDESGAGIERIGKTAMECRILLDNVHISPLNSIAPY